VAASKDRQQHWAKLGARTRLVELRQEISEILRAYPELRRESGSVTGGAGSRRRRHISPEARARHERGACASTGRGARHRGVRKHTPRPSAWGTWRGQARPTLGGPRHALSNG